MGKLRVKGGLEAPSMADRVENALDVLGELANDQDQTGSVRAGAAKAILSAGVTLHGQQTSQPQSAGELTLDQLEERIEDARKRLAQ